MRYRSRPVEIDAIQYTGDNGMLVLAFIHAGHGRASRRWVSGLVPGRDIQVIDLPTREGTMRAMPGDWIIREPEPVGDRRFYPCKPEIFAARYERA